MADYIDSDTCLRFKRRITEIEDKQETTVEQDSLSLSTEDELSMIVSVPKEDQEIAEITSAFVFDPVNFFPKKVKCSHTLDREEKKEVYVHVKEEISGIREYDLGFSGVVKKEDVQERGYSEFGIVCDVEERREVFETVNGEMAGIAEKKEMVEEVEKDFTKDEVWFYAIQEVLGDYTSIEEKKCVVEVQTSSFVQDRSQDLAFYASSDVYENHGSLGKAMVSKTLSKNEEKQFLVESEVGSIIEVETQLVKVTDFGNSEKTLAESVKIEEGFEIDKKGRGNHTSEMKEVNKIVDNDGEKVDGLKRIDGSIRCSLKIEVIDETALIEPVFVSKIGSGCRKETRHEMDGKKEKRPRRRGKGAKKGLEMNEKRNVLTHIVEARNGSGKNGGEGKRVYSRKEMEALRFVNVGKQRKMWYEVYCGTGPAVVREYDDLVNCANQKHIRLNSDPRQRFGKKEEAPAIFGVVAARGRGNHLKIYVH